MAWPDYDKESVEIYKGSLHEVYDPWTAQVLGYFHDIEHAKLFRKAYIKAQKKKGRR